MRVFVAGASGAIGTRLVPQLIDRGHEVIGTSRSPGNAERVRALGAQPIILDLLDPGAVRQAVLETGPDAIVHQATALANVRFSKNLDLSFAQTNRLRTEGTDALLAAAAEAGVRRFVAQSFASYRYALVGGPVKTEDDPLDPTPPAGMRETAVAMSHLDQAVTDSGGLALRYGGFYGAPNDGLLEPVRKRQFRSSPAAVASSRSSTSTTRRPRPSSPSNTTEPAFTTSSTTSRLQYASGCQRSPRRWAPSRPATCPAGSPGCSRARRGSSSEPRPAAPPTQRRSVSSGGRCAIPAGGAASWPPTRRPPRRTGASPIRPTGPASHRPDCPPQPVERIVRRVARRAGVTAHPHQLRHTLATKPSTEACPSKPSPPSNTAPWT
jgi:hypothetical protein